MKIRDLVYFMHNNTIQEAEILEIRNIEYILESGAIGHKIMYYVSFWDSGVNHENGKLEINSNQCFKSLEAIVNYLKESYRKYLYLPF
jgi:hypothetical protein